MSGDKGNSFFDNKVFQATLIVSIVLVSSGFFVSQTDNMFGKAATPITGHMVLYEAGPGGISAVSAGGNDWDYDDTTNIRETWATINSYSEKLFIPGTDCTLFGKCCDSRNYYSCTGNTRNCPGGGITYGSCIDATIDYTNKLQYEYEISCTVTGALNHVSLSYKC